MRILGEIEKNAQKMRKNAQKNALKMRKKMRSYGNDLEFFTKWKTYLDNPCPNCNKNMIFGHFRKFGKF